MTVDDVRQEVDRIKGISTDDESAHAAEDDLRERVLKAIADGAPDGAALATEALKTSDLNFERWCA